MKIKGGGCACLCQGFNPNESQCKCYGCQKPCGGRRACGARELFGHGQEQCCRKEEHGHEHSKKSESMVQRSEEKMTVEVLKSDKTKEKIQIETDTWDKFTEWCGKNGNGLRAC